MKHWIALLAAALLCLMIFPAMGEDATVLTWDELTAWAESYRQRALTAEMLNDPTEEAAFSEDGYALVYDFATLYMTRPYPGDDSVLTGLVIIGEDQAGPRGLVMDIPSASVLNAFYNENPHLEGSRDFAALYAVDSLPDGAAWGWVQRDGQRLEAIQYAVHAPVDGAYTDAGLVITLQADMVAAIRAYGLDRRITEAEVRETMTEVREVMQTTGYMQVPTSPDGLSLQPFQEEDLIFAGVNLLHSDPAEAADALGDAEEAWIENGGDGWLQTLRFPDCVLTYAWDAARTQSRLVMMTIDGPAMEGPRGIRLGDTLASVLNRFRNGEGAYDEAAGTELLYASETGSGVAEYAADASATLRYTLQAESSLITLQIHLESYYVTELILRIE